MADLNQLQVNGGELYNLADSQARKDIAAINNKLTNYLDTASAEETYLKSSEAEKMYLGINEAKSIYLEKNHEEKIGTSEQIGHVKVLVEMKTDEEEYTDNEVLNAKAVAKAIANCENPNEVPGHASATRTDIGDSFNYGHVQLDSTYKGDNISTDETPGVAASIGALRTAYSELNNKIENISVSTDVMVVSMPINPNNGTIVQYIGTTNDDYTHGYFYEYTTQGWEQLNLQSSEAQSIYYNDTNTELSATNVQSAIEALNDKIKSSGGTSNVKNLNDIDDVNINNATNGQALVYRNGGWKNEAISGGGTGGGASRLSDLDDIRISDYPIKGSVLQYNINDYYWMDAPLKAENIEGINNLNSYLKLKSSLRNDAGEIGELAASNSSDNNYIKGHIYEYDYDYKMAQGSYWEADLVNGSNVISQIAYYITANGTYSSSRKFSEGDDSRVFNYPTDGIPFNGRYIHFITFNPVYDSKGIYYCEDIINKGNIEELMSNGYFALSILFAHNGCIAIYYRLEDFSSIESFENALSKAESLDQSGPSITGYFINNEQHNEEHDKIIKALPVKGTKIWKEVYSGNGTSNYEELSNLPSINSVTLTGDKSLSDLGINNFDGDYEKLNNKPEAFPPSEHSHKVEDITDLDLSGKLDANIGSDNQGKYLKVDDNGDIIATNVNPGGGGNSVSVSSSGSSENEVSYITIDDVEYKISGGSSSSASSVSYDNTTSLSEKTNIQDAIDDLYLKFNSLTRASESEDEF